MKGVLLLLLLPTAALAQKKTSQPVAAVDSTYGYTAHNPLRLKQRDLEKSIGLSVVFLRNLRTADDQPLVLLDRIIVEDPTYIRPAIRLYDSQTGQPINGQGGLLDRYTFRTAANDTIRLFVDVYHKGPRLIPKGLKYVGFR